MKIYFAAPLFSEADFNYNEFVVQQIEKILPSVDIYLPQRNDSINDKNSHATPIDIVKGDDEQLLNSDILIALLDGSNIDEGVACEIGVFSTLNKPILGLYTDSRQLGTDNRAKIQELKKSPVSNPFMYRNNYVVGKVQMHGSIHSDRKGLIKELVGLVGNHE